MIFALTDWLRYRFRIGVYGDDPKKNILALGHVGCVAEETLEVLKPGDIIICQRMNSFISWAIMYFGGRYAVDHVGLYIGNGNVFHLTFSGVKKHSIQSLARSARVLPFRPDVVDEINSKNKKNKNLSSKEDSHDVFNAESIIERYSEVEFLRPLGLLLRGIRIVLGLEPTSFSWRYYLDIGFFAVLIDILLWRLNGFPMACTIWGAWLLFLIQKRIIFRFHLKAGMKFERQSHPGLAVLLLRDHGGYIFPNKPVNGNWKVRVFPVWAIPSLLQQIRNQSRSLQSNQENSTSDQ